MTKHTEAPGAALRQLRIAAGLSMKQVAYRAETDMSYLSRVETGKQVPSMAFLGKITRVIADELARPDRTLRAVA